MYSQETLDVMMKVLEELSTKSYLRGLNDGLVEGYEKGRKDGFQSGKAAESLRAISVPMLMNRDDSWL